MESAKPAAHGAEGTPFSEAISRHPIRAYSIIAFAICMLVLVCDGMDAQLLGIVAPKVIEDFVAGQPGRIAHRCYGNFPLPLDPASTMEPVCTPAYASPEHVLSEPLDERSDVYSLSMLFYELLTLTHPLSDKSSVTAVIAAVVTRLSGFRCSMR